MAPFASALVPFGQPAPHQLAGHADRVQGHQASANIRRKHRLQAGGRAVVVQVKVRHADVRQPVVLEPLSDEGRLILQHGDDHERVPLARGRVEKGLRDGVAEGAGGGAPLARAPAAATPRPSARAVVLAPAASPAPLRVSRVIAAEAGEVGRLARRQLLLPRLRRGGGEGQEGEADPHGGMDACMQLHACMHTYVHVATCI